MGISGLESAAGFYAGDVTDERWRQAAERRPSGWQYARLSLLIL
ncbi:MAG: hypothetical protein JWO80_4273 [Bryobacterales bacterium]|nr:hypothetical protein [Bryobacterales bacterium]